MSRILYFTRSHTPQDDRFVRAVASFGFEVLYLMLERLPGDPEKPELPEGAEYLPWKGGSGPFDWEALPELVRDFRRIAGRTAPDLVHAGPVHTAGLIASLAEARPLVVMSWGSDLLRDAEADPRIKFLSRISLNACDAFICGSSEVGKAAAALGADEGKIVFFPWGVDLARFAAGSGELRDRLGWGDGFVLLSMLEWEPACGVDVIARAFATAARERPEIRLLMAGSGSMEPEIRRILEPAGRVHFPVEAGIDGIPDLYRSADVYVSASHGGGSQIPLLEAMASGLPSLVSDIPGNLEWISPGVHGWIFPDGDSPALAGLIADAWRNRTALGQMSKSARATAEQRADWNANMAGIFEAYRIALGGKRRRTGKGF